MAYTRMSSYEVYRACQNFKEWFDKGYTYRLGLRKLELMHRRLFALTEGEANKKVEKENEKEKILRDTINFHKDDYDIYNELIEICQITRHSDFITIDSYEARFINKWRIRSAKG